MILAEVIACLTATALADIRWLRVAQREHYLAGTVSRFVNRWWYGSPVNVMLWIIVIVSIAIAPFFHPSVFVLAAVVASGPVGLSLKGRTSPLAWTRRLKTLAVTTAILQLLVFAIGAALGVAVIAAGVMAAIAPSVIDLALSLTAPWEKRIAQKFVVQARGRLQSVNPSVIAITGSYGKTTTKGYVAHLISGTRSVFATPASFNNRAGLSRAINEQLATGTDIFVAEMGTYGYGEIAELCRLAPPDIAVLTAIGPVHLERFGSEAAVIAAKSEIFENAAVCVVNVDDPRLIMVADKLESEGKKVWRVGGGDHATAVRASIDDDRLKILHQGEPIVDVPAPQAVPSNVACAVAVALEVGIDVKELIGRLPSLPVTSHRQEVTTNAEGVTVIDDTYNANPASVRSGLQLLAKLGVADGQRRVVVTPGIVELGRRQGYENAQFALAASEIATDFVIVGRTNRKALRAGATEAGSTMNVVTVTHLPQAVAWVREHVGRGDVVLYANDLPDHFL